MKKLLTTLFAAVLVTSLALPVLAQDAAAGGQGSTANPDAGTKKEKHKHSKKKSGEAAPKSDEAPKQEAPKQ
jgi:hypothetical protein